MQMYSLLPLSNSEVVYIELLFVTDSWNWVVHSEQNTLHILQDKQMNEVTQSVPPTVIQKSNETNESNQTHNKKSKANLT